MSELLDKQVYVLNECFNINSGIHAGGHASPRKVCDENKRKKVERKKEKENDGRVKIFIRLYQKTGWSDFDQLWVTDSTLNEGTNYLINERKGAGQLVRRALSQNERHKTRNG